MPNLNVNQDAMDTDINKWLNNMISFNGAAEKPNDDNGLSQNVENNNQDDEGDENIANSELFHW
jgi:hypothetical protein